MDLLPCEPPTVMILEPNLQQGLQFQGAKTKVLKANAWPVPKGSCVVPYWVCYSFG